MPVAELCLVAGIGALGLTGHWIRHGCGERRGESTGVLAGASGSHSTPATLPSAGQSGQATWPPACGNISPSHAHLSPLVINTPSLSLLLLPTVHLSEPRLGGKVGTTAGQSLDLPPPPPPGLGSYFRDFWGKSGCHLSSKPGFPGEGRQPGSWHPRRLSVHPVIPPLPFTLSCISNCILLALRRWLLCERLQGMATATATDRPRGLSKGCWIPGKGGQGTRALGELDSHGEES